LKTNLNQFIFDFFFFFYLSTGPEGQLADTMADKPVVNVDIVSDVMCPWCWIGKKKLERGMEQLKDKFQFHVRWLPYLLRPEAPPEGLPIPAGYRIPER
jgi:hypothetical protein